MRTLKTTLLLLTMMLFGASYVNAQTARVQVIHNSADLAAATVDVWLDNTLLLDDFNFRTASPFINAPASVAFDVVIQPSNSTDTTNALFRTTYTLQPNETYVIVANGIISTSGYSPFRAFDLDVFAGAREMSNNGSGETDVLVYHGATDAPMVDVYESSVPAGTLVNDIAYGLFSSNGYLELGTADYDLEVRNAQGSAIVAAYEAPLATLSLGGGAAVVLASGFLDPASNSNGPAFGLYAALPTGGPLIALPTAPIPTARVQVIHNSADLAAATVDVWLNDGMLADDFAFRTATGFVDAQAGVPFDVSIAAPNSTDTVGALFRETYTLDAGETYILVANGIVSTSGYSPASPFGIFVQPMGRETSANGAMETDVLVFHGATDAPTVDVVNQAAPTPPLSDNQAYGQFAGYLELPTADYNLEVRDETSTTVVAAYQAPLAGLNLGGGAITVLASGFLDPSQNSNGPAFGLWAATAAGGALVELPVIPTARVQVIHNAADAAAATVDVYLNDMLLLDDFAFRTASPYIDAPADVAFDIAIAAPNSTDTVGAIWRQSYTLAEGETYQLVANGIVSTSGYSPATPFNIDVFDMAREAASTMGNIDLLVYHGATDAPTVDIEEVAASSGIVVPAISYSEFQGYLELPQGDYALNVLAGGSVVASYAAPLSILDANNTAGTVLASGFLDPSVNSNGPAFGLWLAIPDGGDLIELGNITSTPDLDTRNLAVEVYPNPSTGWLQIDLGEATNAQIEVVDLTGKLAATITANGETRVAANLSDLPKGMYLMKILSDEGTTVRKVVLE